MFRTRATRAARRTVRAARCAGGRSGSCSRGASSPPAACSTPRTRGRAARERNRSRRVRRLEVGHVLAGCGGRGRGEGRAVGDWARATSGPVAPRGAARRRPHRRRHPLDVRAAPTADAAGIGALGGNDGVHGGLRPAPLGGRGLKSACRGGWRLRGARPPATAAVTASPTNSRRPTRLPMAHLREALCSAILPRRR